MKLFMNHNIEFILIQKHLAKVQKSQTIAKYCRNKSFIQWGCPISPNLAIKRVTLAKAGQSNYTVIVQPQQGGTRLASESLALLKAHI